MKIPIRLSASALGLLLLSTSAWADTTVTTNGDTVTVTQQQPAQAVTQVIVQPAGSQTVVLQRPAVVVMDQRDPRHLEGRVGKVDLIRKELTIHNSNGRDQKVLLMKQGMINQYTIDDYVEIYLTRDLKEALKIKTKHSPDLEADVVGVDLASNVIIVRAANGPDRRVIISPSMIQGYQVGDRVRFYVVSENADLQEAQIIRVK